MMKNWKCIVCGEIVASEGAPESCPKCKAPADQFAAEADDFFSDSVGMEEIDDDLLDTVVGGVAVGDVVRCQPDRIMYCSNCAKLLYNYEATITGIRGVLNGHTLYWVTRSCCGWKSSIIDLEIIG